MFSVHESAKSIVLIGQIQDLSWAGEAGTIYQEDNSLMSAVMTLLGQIQDLLGPGTRIAARRIAAQCRLYKPIG